MGNLKPRTILLVGGELKSYQFFLCSTLEALITDTLVSQQFYLKLPSQNPVLLNSRTKSVFLHSSKWPAPVTDTFFAFRGCLLMSAFTVFSSWFP